MDSIACNYSAWHHLLYLSTLPVLPCCTSCSSHFYEFILILFLFVSIVLEFLPILINCNIRWLHGCSYNCLTIFPLLFMVSFRLFMPNVSSLSLSISLLNVVHSSPAELFSVPLFNLVCSFFKIESCISFHWLYKSSLFLPCFLVFS